MPIIESKDIIDHMIANAGHFYADDTPAKAIYRYANPDSPSKSLFFVCYHDSDFALLFSFTDVQLIWPVIMHCFVSAE
jgi:hypothetical protein